MSSFFPVLTGRYIRMMRMLFLGVRLALSMMMMLLLVALLGSLMALGLDLMMRPVLKLLMLALGLLEPLMMLKLMLLMVLLCSLVLLLLLRVLRLVLLGLLGLSGLLGVLGLSLLGLLVSRWVWVAKGVSQVPFGVGCMARATLVLLQL